MIDLTELQDMKRRLIQMLNVTKKDKVSRRILVLISGMIQAVDTIMRLVHFEERKKILLEEQDKRKQQILEKQEKMNVNTP